MHIQEQVEPAAFQASHMGQTLSELRQAEELMSRHVGPTHEIRAGIREMIERFEHLLGI